LALSLAIWQIVTVTRLINPVAVPTMATAFNTLAHNLGQATLWEALGQTVKGMMIGLAIGAVAGILVGTAVGLNDIAYKSCFLMIEFCRTLPAIAVVPLAVLIYGSTLRMAIVLVIYGVFFPMVIQTIYGVRSIDPVVRDTAKMFNFRRRERFFSVTLPSAAPFLATGLRIATAVALLIDILAELTGGGGGLGTGILEGESSGVISYTYALIILTGTLGMILYVGLLGLERRVLSWHELYRREMQL
jgi:ABC-type nitrate/sulfonate/bicarbonate transport system permease component